MILNIASLLFFILGVYFIVDGCNKNVSGLCLFYVKKKY